MIQLQQMVLTNWCQHKELVVDFSATTTGVIGANGSGKSNALEGLRTLLTGAPTDGEIVSMINDDSASAALTLRARVPSGDVRIERTFTAERDEQGVRGKLASTARLFMGEGKPLTGVDKVTNTLADLAGYDLKTIEKHVFVMQDMLRNLLDAEPSVRMAAFQLLMQELRNSEVARERLFKELQSMPPVELPVPASALQQRVTERETELASRRAEYEKQQNVVHILEAGREMAIKVTTARASAVAARAALAEIDMRRAARVQAREELTATLAASRSALEQHEAKLQQLAVQVPAAHAEIARAATQVDTFNQLKRAYEQRVAQIRAVAVEVSDAQAKLAAQVDPAQPVRLSDADVARMRAEADALASDVAVATSALAALAHPTATCPVCHAQITEREALKSEHSATLAKRAQITAITQALEADAQAGRAYAQAVATVQSLRSLHQAALDRALARQASLPPAGDPPADPGTIDVTASRAVLDSVAGLERTVRELRSKVETTTATLNTVVSGLAGDEALRDQALKVIAEDPADSSVTASDLVLKQLAAAQAAVNAAAGAIAMLERETATQRGEYEAAVRIEEREGLRNRYRSFISRVRDGLHRDVVPRILLHSRVARLAEKCNAFLTCFGTPFTVRVSEDMEIVAQFASGAVRRAQRLSGGQRSVLSVCLRLAINEMFSKRTGLVILDEPSAAMDTDNVMALRRLFEHIHRVSANTGVQTVVVTHHAEMLGAFDKVIRIA